MSQKGHPVDQIIAKLRRADVLLGKGTNVPELCKQFEISDQAMDMEVLHEAAKGNWQAPNVDGVQPRHCLQGSIGRERCLGRRHFWRKQFLGRYIRSWVLPVEQGYPCGHLVQTIPHVSTR